MAQPSGHLFIIDGDLTKLHCDAILIPVDAALTCTSTWQDLLGANGRVRDATVPPGWADTVRSFSYRRQQSGPEIWLGDIGRHQPSDDWYAAGLVDFLERASTAMSPRSAAQRLRLAVNVAGSGAGGSSGDKGHLFNTIVPALESTAERLGVDVILVCWGDRQFAAAQRVRSRRSSQSPATADVRSRWLEATAIALADHARRSELVLFIGAGVSMGAGLRSWQGLLDALLDQVDVPVADVERFRQLDVRDQAHLLRRHFSSPERYQTAFAELLQTGGYSLAHGLLASLHTREAVTTNYDNLYESAVRTANRTCAVLPYGPVLDHDRWLLKLHGTIERPDDLVLTRDDYLGLPARAGALFGVLQAMLMTRHMLFVGYSLTDDTFHKVMHEVRQARSGVSGKVGTAVVLFDDPLLTELWGDDLDIVAVSPRPAHTPTQSEVAEAARELELLLDRIGYLAADVTSFLLDPTYRSMLDDDELAISDALNDASHRISQGTGPVAERLRSEFERLGAEPGHQS